jgi:hypothetical protein
VRTQNNHRVFVDGTIDGRKGGSNSGIVSDLTGIIERNVKIHADEYSFVAEVDLINSLFFEMLHVFLY